jgi:hypothetical protein
MIEKACAAEIHAAALKSIEDLTQILTTSRGRCSDEKYEQLKEGIGRSIGQIQMGILEVLISEFPELDDLPR